MKYCVNFKKHFMYLDEVDELKITIKEDSKTSPLFFMSTYSNKRIILDIEKMNENLLKDLAAARKEHPEWRFTACIYETDNHWIPQLINANIPFFFQTYVNNWDTLQGFLSVGVSDMYITEALGFELDKVSALLKPAGIQVRVFPNVAQSSSRITPSLLSFFVRPEDIPVYEEFVDIFEFYGTTEQQETFYRIYAKDKKWYGNLKEMIIGFNDNLDSRFIIPVFGSKRIKCGKKCFKGSSCKICTRLQSMSETLKDKGLMIKTPN